MLVKNNKWPCQLVRYSHKNYNFIYLNITLNLALASGPCIFFDESSFSAADHFDGSKERSELVPLLFFPLVMLRLAPKSV